MIDVTVTFNLLHGQLTLTVYFYVTNPRSIHEIKHVPKKKRKSYCPSGDLWGTCSKICPPNAMCRKSCEVLVIPVLCTDIFYTEVECLLYTGKIPTPRSTSYRVQENFYKKYI